MKASVQIDCGSVEKAVLIPLATVRGGKVQLVQADGATVDKAVKLGLTDGTQVQVLEGLTEGDRVVTK
jgi:hypothetical protein